MEDNLFKIIDVNFSLRIGYISALKYKYTDHFEDLIST